MNEKIYNNINLFLLCKSIINFLKVKFVNLEKISSKNFID